MCTDVIKDESFSNKWGIDGWMETLFLLALPNHHEDQTVNHRCCKLYRTVKSFGTCKEILKRGFSVNSANAGGMTMLHMAFRQNNYPLIHFLLDKGARLTSLGSNNVLPFMSSGELRSKQNLKMVEEYLISKHTSLTRSCKKYRSFRLCKDVNDKGNIVFVISVSGMLLLDDLQIHNNTYKNGVKIVVKQTDSSESKMALMYETEETHSAKTVNLSSDCAALLFTNHSNLNMVSISKIKSKRFGREYHSISNETCITLYCDHKGLIPIGENEFPSQIGEHPTDVREGYCSLASNELTHGETIKRPDLNKTGTIGGFVDLPNGRKGFLTCAHVLHTLDELKDHSFKIDEHVVQVKDSRENRIGKIKEAVFITGRQSEVSVDAALIQIEGNVSGSKNFPNIEAHQLNFTGILKY